MIDDAIFALLSQRPGLIARVGDKIFPLRAPQNTKPPFVIYQRISAPRLRSMIGGSGQANPRFQIDVYDVTFTGARELSGEVRLTLDNFRGEAAGVTIRACSLESDHDLFEGDVDPKLYRVSHDFLLWHDE